VSERAEAPRLDKRKALLGVLGAIILAVAATTLVGLAADFDEVVAALRRADRRWFPLCLAGLACAYTGYILGYREIARMHNGPQLRLPTIAHTVGIGFGANVLGSSAGGLAVDLWALHRAGLGLHNSARRVLGFNTLEWALLGTFAAASGAVVLAAYPDAAPRGMALGWLSGVTAAVAAATLVTSPKGLRRFLDVPEDDEEPATGNRLRWLWGKARKGFADVVGGVLIARHLHTNPRRHPAAVLGFTVYWFGHLLTLWAALRAFPGNTQLLLPTLVLAFATGYAATALPLPGGGSGGIEAALAFSLNAVGVPLASALLAALVYRFFTFWLPLIPALALTAGIGRLDSELEAVAARDAPREDTATA
jgi:uncharacterized membrane protein YbhN (UPF0104 family)